MNCLKNSKKKILQPSDIRSTHSKIRVHMTLNIVITSEKIKTKYINNVPLRNFRDEKKPKLKRI